MDVAKPLLSSKNGASRPLCVVIYLRQSLDTLGDELAVTRQLEACMAICAERAASAKTAEEKAMWLNPRIYRENNTSATKGTRPKYQQLLVDIEAGEVGVLVVWNFDRLHRDNLESEQFIRLARKTGLRIITNSGEVDLETDDGRLFVRMKGVIDIGEIERKTTRQLLAMRQLANAGRPWWASRPFGYYAAPDPTTGGWWLVKHDPKKKGTPEATIYNEVTLHQDEAPLLKAAYHAVLKGGSLHQIAKDWNEDGIKPPKGTRWRGAQVRQLLLAERNAGLRRIPGDNGSAPAYIKGNWEGIVSRDVWEGVCAKLADPKRRHTEGRARKHLLSGIAVCSRCKHPMTSGVTTGTKNRNYRCINPDCRGMARSGAHVDAMAVEAVVDRLSRDDAADLLVDRQREDLDELQAEADALNAQIEAAEAEYDDGIIDGRRLQARKDRVNEKLEPIKAKLRDANKAEVFEGVIGADDVDAAFDVLDLGRKRAVINALVTVTVYPTKSGRIFRSEDVHVRFRPGMG